MTNLVKDEAKTLLSASVDAAAADEQIVIAKNGPVFPPDDTA